MLVNESEIGAVPTEFPEAVPAMPSGKVPTTNQLYVVLAIVEEGV